MIKFRVLRWGDNPGRTKLITGTLVRGRRDSQSEEKM